MLALLFSIIPVIIAGIMNGSYVVPQRYIKRFTHEQVWLGHSIIGVTILPWIFLLIIAPQIISNYFQLSPLSAFCLLLAGMIFGVGQVCFSKSVKLVGIGLSFTVNLGVSIIMSSLFVVLYKNDFFTMKSFWIILSTCLVIISLILYYFAGKRNDNKENNQAYYTGWLLSLIAGVAGGIQNIAFVFFAFYIKTPFQHTTSFWVWPPFLLAAGLVMSIIFLWEIRVKNKTNQSEEITKLSMKNFVLICLMGILFTGSFALYGYGMEHLTAQQQAIGLPAFLISIILTSQILNLFQSLEQTTTTKAKLYKFFSILFLVVGMAMLTLAK